MVSPVRSRPRTTSALKRAPGFLNTTVRLFIALPVDPAAVNRLSGLQQQLASRLPARAVRWVRPEQMHLTLRFLGDVAVSRIECLTAALRSHLATTPAFGLRLDGWGAFPSRRQPRVLWAGLSGALDELRALQAQVSRACDGFGQPAEHRPFQPHLTLGRVTAPAGAASPSVPEALATIAAPKDVSWRATELLLVRSQLAAAGPVYSRWERFALIDRKSDADRLRVRTTADRQRS